ncbi:MAG: hypothetical protein MH825_14495 [Cyanobacteria bacterium]|nr:hypothetical protein [Cyanobacteriota bacterium]
MARPLISTPSDDAIAALALLDRTIDLQRGEFALMLAHCNDSAIEAQMTQLLLARGCDRLAITLPGETQTLYRSIHQLLGPRTPSALLIHGLDQVEHLDDLLVATNRVFNAFSRAFPFPLVLWVNDRVLRQIVTLAPDLKSRAPICIRFTAQPAAVAFSRP